MDMFNDKKRPFYKSAINYALPPLPRGDTIRYLVTLFAEGGKSCPSQAAERIHSLSEGYPYYIQKLSYFVYEACKDKVTEDCLNEGLAQLLLEETPLYETMLQSLRPRQIGLLAATAKEPTKMTFAADYLGRHRLGSVGGVQAALKKLLEMDYLEKQPSGWKVVDPLLALWLKGRESMEA
jgi:hypothetical protein